MRTGGIGAGVISPALRDELAEQEHGLTVDQISAMRRNLERSAALE